MKKFDIFLSIVIGVLQSFAIPSINAMGFTFLWNWLIVGTFDVPRAEFMTIWFCLIFARIFMIVGAKVEID